MRYVALIAALILPAAPVAAGDPVLSLPIDCTLGETCYIQNHVDRDPGPGVLDYTCGDLGYDGHKGTDIGLLSMADMHNGVNVLAAAPGVVRGWRDGVADVGPTDATAGQECGNGVVLRHEDGWETQYCHMKSGSVLVQKGQIIQRGEVLGEVGLSGRTEFPHVHLSVRHDGAVVDPFDLAQLATCGTSGGSLWQTAPDYTPGGLLGAGFSSGIPDYQDIKDGTAAQAELAADATGLVVYGYGFAGQKGDVMDMQITGPEGQIITQGVELKKDQALFFRAIGKRLKQARWPAGEYRATVTMRRGTTVLGQRQIQMTIN